MAQSVTINSLILLSGTTRTVVVEWSWAYSAYTDHYEITWRYRQADTWFDASTDSVDGDATKRAQYSAPEEADQVRCFIRPISKQYEHTDSGETWSYDSSWTNAVSQIYAFINNPPKQPPAPTVSITKQTINVELTGLDLYETGVEGTRKMQFWVIKEGEFDDTNPKPFLDDKVTMITNRAKYTATVDAGYNYYVRCRAWLGNQPGEWSEDSSVVSALPTSPKITSVKVVSETAIEVTWKKVGNAESYNIEYISKTDVDKSGLSKEMYFSAGNATKYNVTIDKNAVEKDGLVTTSGITNLTGSTYYIRICSVNSSGDESEWSNIMLFSVGTTPTAPTTWSSTNSVVVGEPLTLYWLHNSEDGSISNIAMLHLKILELENVLINEIKYYIELSKTEENGNSSYTQYEGLLDGVWLVRVNKSDPDEIDDNTYVCEVNTNHDIFKAGYTIEWRVRAAGVKKTNGTEIMIDDDGTSWIKHTKKTGDTAESVAEQYCITVEELVRVNEWISADSLSFMKWCKIPFVPELGEYSTTRKVDVYSAPAFKHMYIEDVDGELINSDDKPLTSFPFYIRAEVADSVNQKPVTYYVNVVALSSYTTIDNFGNSKVVAAGSTIYSEHFDTSENTLEVPLSADNIDLDNNMQYKVNCVVFMSSGLNAEMSREFAVAWTEKISAPIAGIFIDKEKVSAEIIPYIEGSNADDVTLSVYRREFDGSYTEIEKDVSSNSSVIDPHPALDYARYRIVAKSKATGAINYTDMPGYKVGIKSIIIQWNEAWEYHNAESQDVEEDTTSRAESILKLPYNINVSNSHSPDVSLVSYAGRKRQVSYYGTQLGESASWSVVIPKTDVEALYAIRRLAVWMGDVYVREPSGTGYWAHITVSYSHSYDSLTIPVSFSITPVEGGK